MTLVYNVIIVDAFTIKESMNLPYTVKKYTIVFGTDGARLPRKNDDRTITYFYRETKLADDLEDNVIIPIDGNFSSNGYTRAGYFDTLAYINGHAPDVNALRNKVLTTIYNTPAKGILIIAGHFDSYKYYPYKFSLSTIEPDEAGDEPFPKEWAEEALSVSISASTVGNHFRSLPKDEMPAFVMVLGCNSMKIDAPGKTTWRWAFRLSEYNGDFPDYWVDRAGIGAKTELGDTGINLSTGLYVSVWGEFIKRLIHYMLSQSYPYYLWIAAKRAYFDIYEEYMKGYPLRTERTLGVLMEVIDYVGEGEIYRQYLNSTPTDELLIIVGDGYLQFDPTYKDQAISMALSWFNTYFRENFNDLYNYIEKYGLSMVVVKDNSDLLKKGYTVILSRIPIDVSVDFVVVGNKLVFDGFDITVMIPRDYQGDCDLKELADIIKKYKYFNYTMTAYDYLVNHYGFKLRHQGFKIVSVLEFNRSGFMVNKEAGVSIQLRYDNRVVAIINSKGTYFSDGAVAMAFYWWGPSTFYFSLGGLSSFYKVAEIINSIPVLKKPVWKYDRITVAKFLSLELGVDVDYVYENLQEYIGLTTNGTIRPVYLFRYKETIGSGHEEYDKTIIAMIYADTGEAVITTSISPLWGTAKVKPSSITFRVSIDDFFNRYHGRTSSRNNSENEEETKEVLITTTTTSTPMSNADMDNTGEPLSTTTTPSATTTTKQQEQETKTLIRQDIAILLAAIVVTIALLLVIRKMIVK